MDFWTDFWTYSPPGTDIWDILFVAFMCVSISLSSLS
jgi:hypothetical protein